MTGLCRTECHLGCGTVANLADQDDIGILPKAILQSVGERNDIVPHFALRDNRIRIRREEILDRILHRDDPVPPLLIQQVDDHRQGRRLARSGDAADQDEAVTKVCQPIGQVGGKTGPCEFGDRPPR